MKRMRSLAKYRQQFFGGVWGVADRVLFFQHAIGEDFFGDDVQQIVIPIQRQKVAVCDVFTNEHFHPLAQNTGINSFRTSPVSVHLTQHLAAIVWVNE